MTLKYHPWENEDCYALILPELTRIIPSTLALQGPTRSPPNITFDKPPGSPAGNEFALGDGQSSLLPLVFRGPMTFETEAERDLYVAAIDIAAAEATYLERMEKSGPLGRAPGFARWQHGRTAIQGELTITVYPTARPQIGGQEVDW